MAILKRLCITAFVFAAIYSKLIPAACAQGSGDVASLKVSVAEGEQHVAKKIDPVYPPLAKSAHIEGTVVLSALVSPAGVVEKVEVINGHPMLVQAAIDAVKQRQYNPFLRDGSPVTTLVPIEVAFSLPLSSAERAADDYSRQEYKCRAHVEQHLYADAVEPCKTLVEMAEKRPPEEQKARRHAYRYAGDAFWFQNKFPEAQAYYLKELASAEKVVELYPHEPYSYSYSDSDGESLAHAYHDAAHGFQGVGDFTQAGLYYQRAEQILEEQYAQVQSASLKNQPDKSADPTQYGASVEVSRFLKRLKKDLAKSRQSVLRDYAALLRQTGDTSAADAAEQKAKSLSEGIDSKEQ